ncbi:Slp family lipoprotein [Lysinibacillus sp. G4S2]|uniref:Slp family lipoprotein n=1 Tax=Lysinibacillus sp. G4S2 TaxID=3055859 RepID=UPI0025A094DF|nr:Slp family lipoprotein [Lysinibacillus sp. G4S2]MDM5245773.1 Slp family lipoprotein [Lysinibacillus sp. G4S2]
MGTILAILGMLGFFVGLVLLVIGLIRKKKMKGGLVLGISIVVFIVGFIMVPTNGTESSTDSKDNEKVETVAKPKEETPEEKAAREKKEAEEKALAEQKAKEEAEAKAKAEEEARIKAEQAAAAKKANAKTIDYPQLKKNPDRYKGEYVKYTGKILQILEGDNVTNIRLAVTPTSYGYDPNDVIFIEYYGYTDFVDDDIITVYGEIYGSYSYKSQAGFDIALPGLLAKEFE